MKKTAEGIIEEGRKSEDTVGANIAYSGQILSL
jgi:hypothetical protein